MRQVFNAILDVIRALVLQNKKLDSIYQLQLSQGDQLDIILGDVSLDGVQPLASAELTALADRFEASAARLKSVADQLTIAVLSED